MLAAADVKVLPSVPTKQGKREGIPVGLMEAMASGLPVVSSWLSGIPELVEDGVAGILAAPRDVNGLAEALFRLSRDPELRRRMGEAGRAKVLREFNLEKNAEELARLFLAIIDH
jgi:glycosyltransferase involved in cell wall biosynthesis